MHEYFRQYGQQMGMQRVRFIESKQIDMLLNTAINDIVLQIIRETLNISTDKIAIDNAKLPQLNALESLYKVEEVNLLDSSSPFSYLENNDDFAVFKLNDNYNRTKAMLYYSYSINYCKCDTSNIGGWISGITPVKNVYDSYISRYFDCRLIEDSYLSKTLNDSILKPKLESPIININLIKDNKLNIELYFTKLNRTTGLFNGALSPYKLRLSYISYPNKVKYISNESSENINCDLPDYMHIDFIKRAVDLYRVSVTNSQFVGQETNNKNN